MGESVAAAAAAAMKSSTSRENTLVDSTTQLYKRPVSKRYGAILASLSTDASVRRRLFVSPNLELASSVINHPLAAMDAVKLVQVFARNFYKLAKTCSASAK